MEKGNYLFTKAGKGGLRMESSLFTYIESYSTQLKDYTLFIVCNTKSATNTKRNYKHFDIATEYLSDIEFEQVISLFDQCRLKDIEIFQNEYSFIDYILKHRPQLDNKKIIVYSSAQSGTGAGRKSLIPAFCQLENLPCTGSNPYVVSLCRQKYHVNKLLEASNIPVPRTFIYNNGWLFDSKPSQRQEILLKPIYESASIGIDANSLKSYTNELDTEIQVRNNEMQQPIIAQEFIEGYEVEFPIYINQNNIFPLLPVGLSLPDNEPRMGKNYLDYERIYFDQYNFYDFRENENYNNEMVDIVKNVALLLGMHGLCRVDFRIMNKYHFYITDVSTNPHFISHSSIHFAFKLLGLPETSIAKSILLSAL